VKFTTNVNIIAKKEKIEKPIDVNNYIEFLLTSSQYQLASNEQATMSLNPHSW
jgi:hypothetical protein